MTDKELIQEIHAHQVALDGLIDQLIQKYYTKVLPGYELLTLKSRSNEFVEIDRLLYQLPQSFEMGKLTVKLITPKRL